METLNNKALSPQAKFLMQCIGYRFFRKKSHKPIDKWEVYAMGYRDINHVTSERSEIEFIILDQEERAAEYERELAESGKTFFRNKLLADRK